MGIYNCNWKDCNRKPYSEIFYTDEDGDGKWCYLCLWHYIWIRLRGDDIGSCRVDTDREVLEHIREEIWDMESDLSEIKEKLKIKSSYIPLEKLWDNKEDEAWNDYYEDIPLTEDDWNKRVKEKLNEKKGKRKK